ncbi:MAG: lysostaphin resistance A-like protein [Clostridia bacterium]
MDHLHLRRLAILYGILATLAVWIGLVLLQNLLATFVCFHLLVCCGVPLLHGWREGNLRERWRVAWRQLFSDAEGLFVGLATGTVLCLVIVAGLGMLLQSGASAEWVRHILTQWGLTEMWLWLFIIYIILVNSLLEELMWRGFLLELLEKATSPVTAMVISSFFYALYHIIIGSMLFGWKWGIVITVAVFFCGFVLG